MSHLILGFKDLVNSSPNNSIFDLSSLFFDDTYLKSISPKRYNFYVKFVSGLSNPSVLEKFFYKTKEARDFKSDLNNKASILANLITRLNNNYNKADKDKIIEDISNAIKNKFKLNESNIEKIDDILKKGGDKEEEDFVDKNTLNKGSQPMKTFLKKVNEIAPDIVNSNPMTDVNELIKEKKDNPKEETNRKLKSDTIKELKNVYYNYKDTLSPDKLKITFIDRVIFIITTFLIRFITLTIINWGLNTNIISSFNRAFNFYCLVYIIFFIFITMIVNVIVYYPIMELFSNNNIINIPNLFYYFYVYTNGSVRLLVHIFIIILLMFIPYVINMDKLQLARITDTNKNISYNYEQKNKIYDAINLFSLIIWILTSIIAIKL